MRRSESDAELLGAAREDAAAFEALYRRHVRRVTMFAARRCDDPEGVVDVVAMTFVAVLDSAHRYDSAQGDVLPWMLGITRNLALDVHRSHRRERQALARVAGQRELQADEFAEIEERLDAARSHDSIEAAMRTLPAVDRDVLRLAGDQDLSYGDAAHTLGITTAAFRMRLMRSRRALRRALASTPSDPSAHSSSRDSFLEEHSR